MLDKNDLSAIKEIIKPLRESQDRTEKRLDNLERGQARTNTVIEAIAAGQKDFATKADLQNFATKADLQNFATKADLQNFATKADLKNMKTELKAELASKEDVIKLGENLRNELASKADVMDLKSDLTKRVKSHERRINTIEDELNIPHPHKN